MVAEAGYKLEILDISRRGIVNKNKGADLLLWFRIG